MNYDQIINKNVREAGAAQDNIDRRAAKYAVEELLNRFPETDHRKKGGRSDLMVIINQVDPERLYSLPDVARLMGVSRHAVRLWCVNGDVPHTEIKTRGQGKRKHRRITGWSVLRLAKDMLRFIRY